MDNLNYKLHIIHYKLIIGRIDVKKNYVKIVLCVQVFLWIMGASVLFAQEVKAVKLKKPLRPQSSQRGK